MTPEELEIRKTLWSNHGHQMIYGDDGEMQCAECMILDFKRDSFAKIAKQMVRATQAEQRRKDAEIARGRWRELSKHFHSPHTVCRKVAEAIEAQEE